MKPLYIFFLIVSLISISMRGITQAGEDLVAQLKESRPDTNRVNLLFRIAASYYFSKPDTCMLLTNEALTLSEELNYVPGKLRALNFLGESLRFIGKYPQALDFQLKALELYKKTGNVRGEAGTLGFIGITYMELNEYREGLDYLLQAKQIFDKNKIDETNVRGPKYELLILSNIGYSYENINKLDSSLFYQQIAWDKAKLLSPTNVQALILTRLGNIFVRIGKNEQAFELYHQAQEIAQKINDVINLSKVEGQISELYHKLGKNDSALYYARQSFANSISASHKLQIRDAANVLVKLYREDKNTDSLIYYQDIAVMMNDSLFGSRNYRELQLLTLDEQRKKQELLQEQQKSKARNKMIALLILLGSVLVIALLLFRNVRHKQKVNVILQDQKNEIQKNLSELKATQAQLIQSEKMASLGELTAGIAHEIQNPLNFVNNFSEVNTELIDELEIEAENGNLLEIRNLAKNIKENEQKINHHGKRADAIVKGMLQHSRSSTGQKEATDINALVDEYLRLSYHGLRAKDKSFNAKFTTDFDTNISRINIVAQDIGRVVLNLINNAFYAVNDRSKSTLNGYEPTVSVITRKLGDKVEIRVKDNGTGISQQALEKIFQPFFTTKPAGQGTGLGLSLSYDIVKSHGGELNVETTENVGSTFIIQLPYS